MVNTWACRIFEDAGFAWKKERNCQLTKAIAVQSDEEQFKATYIE